VYETASFGTRRSWTMEQLHDHPDVLPLLAACPRTAPTICRSRNVGAYGRLLSREVITFDLAWQPA